MTGIRKDSEKNSENTNLADALSNKEVQHYIHDYYKAEGKEYYARTAIARWKKGTHYPPVEILIGIAKILHVNVAYLLDLTEVDAECDYEHKPKEHTLDELMELRGMNGTELANALNKNFKAVYSFREKLPLGRITSLMKLSSALELSVDYILGYTTWETWEMCRRVSSPFSSIDAGAGAYLVADKNVRSIADVEEAIRHGNGQYCLVSGDGKSVIFPNGNRFSIDDDLFLGVYVAKVKPEVD